MARRQERVLRGGGYDVEKGPSSGVVWLGGDSFKRLFFALGSLRLGLDGT